MQPEIPFLPVFASMKRLARYNLGSVALGSLIVSFVESVRFILEAIRRRTKVSGTTPDHWFWRMAHYTSRGCLKSVEWTIKSVNRNAYIMIAITGKSFCKSSAIATELIISNILRIGKVNVIGDVILFLGQLCACWALGYIVATLFFPVLEMSIDTIILSFCQDSEENQGNAQHAPPLLLETLDSNQEEEVQRLTH
ncbi:choline transporter-like protein 2 [Arabidopsis lyrata subsp. lyrata]|nr:choline transporter-like protein 2 [Arabidopsis lyrata subsp. lyrata]|eukprot:XP_020872043.1 choline transporter-like protein 2 [Arabidopsis lyrata subsp. lyrata]